MAGDVQARMKVPDSLSALQAGGGPVGQSAAAGGCPSDAGCMLPGRNPCRREAGTGSRSAEEKLLCEFLEVGGGDFEKFGFTGLAAEFDLLTFVGKDDGFTHAAEFFIGEGLTLGASAGVGAGLGSPAWSTSGAASAKREVRLRRRVVFMVL